MNQRNTWVIATATGLILGVVAGLISLINKGWYDYSVPAAMVLASFVVVNRVKERRFWGGFTGAFLTGMIGWGIYMITHFSEVSTGHSVGQVIMLSLAYLLPMVMVIGVFGSWFFARSKRRMEDYQQKVEAEKKKKQVQYQDRPKNKKKKKK